jgi:hypothetical protein
MNPKLLFLVYGVFAVGNNYKVSAQIIAAACGDLAPHQNNLSSVSAEDLQIAPPDIESLRQIYPPPLTNDVERRRRGQLLYYCHFSGKALETFIC